ncbi:endothelial cell-selective adhesion molecule-like [Cyprinus carpio]|uniref:Endothelial cell-selective adhesion molecule-like n=1 Tax=Cyprinus carpio TaxID=7962 RepID=A0A9R0AEQ7_CYPCA|nr:endothelial cell-selective adhesion molecule-like [Cyprinus carpio]
MGQMVCSGGLVHTPTNTSIEKERCHLDLHGHHSKQVEYVWKQHYKILVISYFSGQIGIGSTDFRRRGCSLHPPHLCCSMTENPVLNGNVTLSCKSSYGKPVPQYKWTKAAPLSEVFFSPMQKWRSCPQPVLVLGYLDERQGTLRLSNLTKSMSGKYVCRASNTAGTDSCHINLEVSTPASNAWVIAGATVGSVVGLMALVLFLIFILRRNRDTEEEMANDIKEDAQAPKRVSWTKSGTGSDIISKNGTLSSIATSPPAQDPQHPLQNNHYPYPPGASDTASILTTSGSTTTYRLRPGDPNPLHGLPGYNASGHTKSHTPSPP